MEIHTDELLIENLARVLVAKRLRRPREGPDVLHDVVKTCTRSVRFTASSGGARTLYAAQRTRDARVGA
jgi:hypothetical protein